MKSGSKSYDYNQCKVGPNPTTIIQSKVGQNPTTIIQFDAGQNPTLNYMRRILTRTMDMLIEFCIAGQNPTRVKMLRNSPLLLLKIFYGTMTGTNFNSTFNGFLLLNRIMPKCNTVLQSENDLFEPEIQPNSHGNC